MATITLTIPSADLNRVTSALCAAGGFSEVNADNAQSALLAWALRVATSVESEAAAQAASDALKDRQAAATTNGAAWVQPTSAANAYPVDRKVTYGGKTWVNLTPSNTWSPGLAGWREVVAQGGAPAAWVQPSGSTDAYKVGDKVTYQGKTWVSTNAANVWPPGTGALWTVV